MTATTPIAIRPTDVQPATQGLSLEHPDGSTPVLHHLGCTGRADVSVDLDCAYCPTCQLNIRISGAMVVELLEDETMRDFYRQGFRDDEQAQP